MNPPDISDPNPEKTSIAPPPSDPWIGRTLKKKYAIVAQIGRGGMGVVYLAQDIVLRRVVAVKRIADSLTNESKGMERFLREARTAAQLQHTNVVAIYEIDQEQGTHYLVMEFVPGPSAQQIIDRDGALRWRAATQIVIDACRGLRAAHASHLIHRDIKPANLLVSRTGEVKLGDFGLAKVAMEEQTAISQTGVIIGTPQFMSPEQAKNEDLDERSDLYSLGATFYALLTGTPPFAGRDAYSMLYAHATLPVPDPRKRVADIPEACVKILQRAMAKRRSDRYASADEMLADLEAALGPQREPLGPMAEHFDFPQCPNASFATPNVQLTRYHKPRKWIGVSLVIAGFALCLIGFIACGGAAIYYWINRPAVAERGDDSPNELKRELIARNPGFDGKFTALQVRDRRIVKLSLPIDDIADITPLGMLTDLEELELHPHTGKKSRLANALVLEKLTKLTRLRLSNCLVKDFEFLRKLKQLTHLNVSSTEISDLTVLTDLPLRELQISASNVKSLRGLEKAPLERLEAAFAYNLASLEGLPTKNLRWLDLQSTLVPDLRGLTDAGELRFLDFHWTTATIKQRPTATTGRSVHPEDMKVLLRLGKLESIVGELFTQGEEAALRKAHGKALSIKRVPPGNGG